MSMIKVSSFGGMIPKLGDRLLPEANASYAENCKVYSGNLVPLYPPSTVSTPTKTGPFTTIFRARNGASQSAWFSWATDVDCVRVPLSSEVESRFVWTGDGSPKVAKYSVATQSGTNNYPSNFLELGIPAPQTVPVATPSGGIGADVDRYYVYTFFSADGEESAPSPVSVVANGKVDGTWSVTMPDTAPANSGTGSAVHLAGITTHTNTGLHWLRAGDKIVISAVTLTVLSTPTTSTFTVAGNYAGAVVAWTRLTNWNTVGMTRRLYRTTSGTTGAFQLVAAGLSSTPYSDTLLDDAILGDDLISDGWLPPPIGLTGVSVHSSGALCGYVGNKIYMSEPLQPHAWPLANTYSAGYDGVGMATFGSTVVLATAGSPYVLVGSDPASMTGEEIPGTYPCVSKRSVTATDGGVIYASKYGLVSVGVNGVNVISEQFYTRDEWDLLVPTTMVCAIANGRIYVKYVVATGVRILIVDGVNLTVATVNADDLYADPGSGELFISDGINIKIWDDITKVALTANWKSKEFSFPKPVNIGAGKVEFYQVMSAADIAALTAARNAAIAANAAAVLAGAIGGTFNFADFNGTTTNGSVLQNVSTVPTSNTVTINLYRGVDNTLVASRTVSNNKVFRFPSGYKDDAYLVQVISQSRVEEVRLAETPDGLKVA